MSIGILFGDVLAQIPLLTIRVEEKSIKFTIFAVIHITINIVMNILFVVHLNKE